MLPLSQLLARAHLPLTALAIVAGLTLAAASRDLMKRLLGATVAMLAAAAHLAAAPGADGVRLGAIVLAFAGAGLGLALVVRLRETFGAVTVRRVQAGLDEDDARVERET